MTTKRVFVAGATGYLGRHLVSALKEAGHEVVALARDRERLRGSGGGLSSGRAPDVYDLCDSIVEAQATRPETLKGICDGCDVWISALGKRDMGRRPTVFEVDQEANLNLLEEALRAEVPHLMFVSALKGDVLRSAGVELAMAREAVVDAIKASGRSWTIFRPTGFFNDMEEFFRMCQKGTGWSLGDGSLCFNPIHGADLARVIAQSVGDPAQAGRDLSVGGPDVFTYRQILELAFETLGTPPRIRSVPFWLLRVAAAATRPFSPMAGGLMHTFWVMREHDMVAESVGERHLRDLFEELAAERG